MPATSLKILRKNLYSVKSYDQTNMNVFASSLWENFSWGSTYFNEFIYTNLRPGCTLIYSETQLEDT